nr:MAG TPA: hypothetical protein [Caudoviricetes sp.]
MIFIRAPPFSHPCRFRLLSRQGWFFVARKQDVSVKYPAAFRLQFQKAAIFGCERRGNPSHLQPKAMVR